MEVGIRMEWYSGASWPDNQQYDNADILDKGRCICQSYWYPQPLHLPSGYAGYSWPMICDFNIVSAITMVNDFGLSVRPSKPLPPVHKSVGPSDQPWPFFGLSVRPERFPGISRRFFYFWRYFDLVKRIKFGVSRHFPEDTWRWLEILHADLSLPPSKRIRFPRRVLSNISMRWIISVIPSLHKCFRWGQYSLSSLNKQYAICSPFY